MLPAFRGDALINLDFNAINKMSEVTGVEIKDLAGLSAALNAQLDRFHKAGCVAADIATEGLEFEPVTGKMRLQSSIRRYRGRNRRNKKSAVLRHIC